MHDAVAAEGCGALRGGEGLVTNQPPATAGGDGSKGSAPPPPPEISP